MFRLASASAAFTARRRARASYRESLMAQEYRLLEGPGAVCLYQDIPDGAFPKSFYPALDRAKIKARIRAGTARARRSCWTRCLPASLPTGSTCRSARRSACFSRSWAWGSRCWRRSGSEHETAPGEYMRQLFDCQTIGQLQCALNRILLEICGAIKRGRAAATSRF